MPQSQQDIDALLAEVNALAEEAVGTIAADGEDEIAPAPRVAEPAIPPAYATLAPGAVDRTGSAGRSRSEDVSRILRIEVPVIVQLAERTMPLSDILKLTSGAIIEFEKPADNELDLMINNKCIGQGQAVKVAENFGLRLTRIGSVRERIQALGGQ